MDPFLLLWIVPVAVAGAGAAATVRYRGRRRRLSFDAARLQLAEARSDAVAKTAELKVARAELARITAERGASRATSAEVAAARTQLRLAEQDAKAASALVRARRARVAAARSELTTLRDPLERLYAAHDAVNNRWMTYETDPARAIAFPQMSDVKVPTTAAFFDAQAAASQARPAADARKITPAEFAAYRDAVAALERALIEAERAAGAVPTPRPAWQETAHQVIEIGAEALRSLPPRRRDAP